MKTTFLNTLFTAGLLSAFSLGFTACNVEKEQNTTQEDHQGTEHGGDHSGTAVVDVPDYASVDQGFQGQLTNAFTQYLKIKDGLVAAKVEDTRQAATDFITQLEKMDASKLTPEQKTFFEEHAGMAKQHVQAMAKAGDIAGQRAQLDMFSSSMFSLVKAFGANSQTAYYQHCPMANEEKGANWISQEKEIRNPYFGEKMLKCGETKEALAAK